MSPKIKSGQLVTVKPTTENDIQKGDIVFCRLKGRHYVHLVTATKQKMGGKRFQIGNNHGYTNGWIGFDAVFGKVAKVED